MVPLALLVLQQPQPRNARRTPPPKKYPKKEGLMKQGWSQERQALMRVLVSKKA
jgi:hypothetical protein